MKPLRFVLASRDADPRGAVLDGVSTPSTASARAGWFRWLMSVFGGAAAIIIFMALVSWGLFGTVAGGVSWLRGEPLALSVATLRFHPAKIGERRQLAFEVTNLSFRPVYLLGGKTDCSCVSVNGLPVVVPARTTIEIPVTVVVRPGSVDPTVFSQPVVLNTQLESQPRLVGRIEGKVLPSSGPGQPLVPVPEQGF